MSKLKELKDNLKKHCLILRGHLDGKDKRVEDFLSSINSPEHKEKERDMIRGAIEAYEHIYEELEEIEDSSNNVKIKE